MKHLIIYAHPYEGSFCNAILNSYEAGLKEYSHDVKLRNLYEIGFEPVLGR